jgi:hypothetical protein
MPIGHTRRSAARPDEVHARQEIEVKLAAQSNPESILTLRPNLTSYLWRLMEVGIPGGDEDEND